MFSVGVGVASGNWDDFAPDLKFRKKNQSKGQKKIFRPKMGKGLTRLLQFRPEDRRNRKKVAFVPA
jgi:hypothetical protein